MINTIKLVVFDMAGTTINEKNLVYKTIQKVINDAGFAVTLDQVLAYGAGKEKHQAITDVLTHCTQFTEVSEKATAIFKQFKLELAEAYANLEAKPFDGIEGLFEKLRAQNIKVALNTGYNAKTTATLLVQVDWKVGRDIDAVVHADDVERGRPYPDMIQKVMKDLAVLNPEHVLKAGDSAVDIQEGKNAKCGLTVGVLTGAQNKAQLQEAQPDYILSKLTDLADFF